MVTMNLTGGNGAAFFQCGAGNDKIICFKPSGCDIEGLICQQFEPILHIRSLIHFIHFAR